MAIGLAATRSERRTTITLNSTVLFREDSDKITTTARERLARVVIVFDKR